MGLCFGNKPPRCPRGMNTEKPQNHSGRGGQNLHPVPGKEFRETFLGSLAVGEALARSSLQVATVSRPPSFSSIKGGWALSKTLRSPCRQPRLPDRS